MKPMMISTMRLMIGCFLPNSLKLSLCHAIFAFPGSAPVCFVCFRIGTGHKKSAPCLHRHRGTLIHPNYQCRQNTPKGGRIRQASSSSIVLKLAFSVTELSSCRYEICKKSFLQTQSIVRPPILSFKGSALQ